MSRPPQKGIVPPKKWRQFKTLEEAEDVAIAARVRGQKSKRGKSRNLKAASAETEPEASRESVP
jgi:hypothetical protein